jgi:hypothetical protein
VAIYLTLIWIRCRHVLAVVKMDLNSNSNQKSNGCNYKPLGVFYYSPVHWKEMDYIMHDIHFRNLVRQPLPKQTKDFDAIGSFVDCEQSTHFVTSYTNHSDTIHLAISEMVDGVARSISSPENMTIQLIRYASLPTNEQKKYHNIFVSAICNSEHQPHANIFCRLFIGELQYTKKGIAVPSTPSFTLKRWLVSKHLDTKMEEYVNGCECSASYFGCSR